MNPKAGHKEKAYELLRRREFNFPFTFSDWQLEEKYMLMREKLRERKYTVKDTGIPYRVINHWELSKLLPEGVNVDDRQKESSWRTFSLAEMAWLKVVAHLRSFGLPLKQIYIVKQYIIHWNKKYEYYPAFEYCLAQALFSSKDTYMRILSNGIADLVSLEQIEMEKIIKGSSDMILISIKSILKELDLSFPEIQHRLELSDEEFELFDEIRHKGNNEIKTVIKDGKISEIETSKMLVEPFSDMSEVENLKKGDGYGRITEQIEKGRKRSVQVVERKKFSKK